MPIADQGVGKPPTPVLPDHPDATQINLDESQKYLRDGAGSYTRYTPVITGTSGGFTYGTNAFQSGRWKRIGSQCHVYFEIFFGSPGFASGANTQWFFSLPFNAYFPANSNLTLMQAGSVFVNSGNHQSLNAGIIGNTAPKVLSVSLSEAGPGAVLAGLTGGGGAAWNQGAIVMANLLYECTS